MTLNRNRASWIESPAQRADRLERERNQAIAIGRDWSAMLAESRRKWDALYRAVCAVAMTKVAVLIAVLLIAGGLK